MVKVQLIFFFDKFFLFFLNFFYRSSICSVDMLKAWLSYPFPCVGPKRLPWAWPHLPVAGTFSSPSAVSVTTVQCTRDPTLEGLLTGNHRSHVQLSDRAGSGAGGGPRSALWVFQPYGEAPALQSHGEPFGLGALGGSSALRPSCGGPRVCGVILISVVIRGHPRRPDV